VKSKSRKKAGGKKRGGEGDMETDEGDMESWEVDYMSDSSSDEEPQQKVGHNIWTRIVISLKLLICVLMILDCSCV